MKYIFFFATPSDIAPVLRRFEADGPLKYVDPTIMTTPNRAIYLSSREIPNPGISTSESGNGSKDYIVSYQDTKNHLHSFVDNGGQRRWMVSNGDNPETVVLTLAGLWKTGTLLPGNMSTLHQSGVAQQIMRRFLSALKAEGFKQVDNYWLGPESLAMLRAGKRLAKNGEQSPPEFDLQLPESAR